MEDQLSALEWLRDGGSVRRASFILQCGNEPTASTCIQSRFYGPLVRVPILEASYIH